LKSRLGSLIVFDKKPVSRRNRRVPNKAV